MPDSTDRLCALAKELAAEQCPDASRLAQLALARRLLLRASNLLNSRGETLDSLHGYNTNRDLAHAPERTAVDEP